MPLTRAVRALAAGALALLAGCGSTAPAPSSDSAAPSAEPDAAALRAAALTDADLGPGWTVTLMNPGQGDTTAPREKADRPACQPILDAVSPGASGSGPLAEADLDIARADDGRRSVYAGLLAFRAGRAERIRAELDQLLTVCTVFHSAAAGGPTTTHRLQRIDTPTPEGADAATAFTLTNESEGTALVQRALMARTGEVLAVFTTVGSPKEPAPEPDRQVVRAQLARLARH
ncbi:hypothetical protein ACGFX4_05860 [Kitasatospora sp. NPDC048365]|uniref:hypothetical protein n=1 Tax=Kitasatospora sp. NPDC048365 TaxID=3364050 RepID=UPI00372184C5